jgi:hypothetical protein
MGSYDFFVSYAHADREPGALAALREQLEENVRKYLGERGQTVTLLLGPSGVGKSTLISGLFSQALEQALAESSVVKLPIAGATDLPFEFLPDTARFSHYAATDTDLGHHAAWHFKPKPKPDHLWETPPDRQVQSRQLFAIPIIGCGKVIGVLKIDRDHEISVVRVDAARFRDAFIRLLRLHLRRLNKIAAILLRHFRMRAPDDELVTVERKWFLYHGVGRPPRPLSWAATGLF